MLGNVDFSKSLVKTRGLSHELKNKRKRKKLALGFWHSATYSISDKWIGLIWYQFFSPYSSEAKELQILLFWGTLMGMYLGLLNFEKPEELKERESLISAFPDVVANNYEGIW